MIDTACILFSALMCVFVAFRAIQLDKAVAWFAGALPAIRAAGAAMLPAGLTAAPRGWRERGAAAEPAKAQSPGWRERSRPAAQDRTITRARRGRPSRARPAQDRTHAS